MTTFADVNQFLEELERKHMMCALCGNHIKKVREATASLEHIDNFVGQIGANPRLLQLLREVTRLADKLMLLAILIRFSKLFDKILRMFGV